ncbi:MAG: T9SS C-terminal target domain-containing protein, partial [Calditrichaeota bacterium]
PCDLYYMDLDGIWEDNLMKPATGPLVPGSDGIFDTHSANYPRSTERPDIVVGRITPTPGMGNSADIVNYYLDKCHNYRHDLAGIRQNFRALAYPDDDWHQWGNDIANLYMSKVFQEYLSIYDINHTTATDYGARLDDGFSLIHVWVHSWSGGHAFSINNGTQSQYFYNYQILTSHANANFYQLFACGNSRYIQEGNCAAIYALQTTHGINTIGSTHSGGMLEFDYFYIVLSEGLSYGEAFLKTFRHAGEIKFSPEMRGWYYGLTFNGDPYIIPEPSAATSIVQQSDVNIPDSWYIQNYPNPFNSTTQIEYHCPVAGNVKVTIYNALGEIVRNLVDEWQNAGTNKVFWNGMDNNGQAVASGIYYYRLQAGDNHMETKKMLLLR